MLELYDNLPTEKPMKPNGLVILSEMNRDGDKKS